MNEKPITGFEKYVITDEGYVRHHKYRSILKPDKSGCVCLYQDGKRKTFSIAKLVAISFLNMPDDRKHHAFKKDPNGGYEVSNITYDSLTNLNKDRLAKAIEAKRMLYGSD